MARKKSGDTEPKGGGKLAAGGEAAPIHAEAEVGTIADTRRTPVVDPDKLWSPPATYKALDRATIQGLTKIAADQDAEVELAVKEVVNKKPPLSVRFGELAPDVSPLPGLWKRYRAARADFEIATRAAAYFGDVYQVALSDILQIVGAVDEVVRPASSRNAALAHEFGSVLKISDQRGAAAREGRLRARAGGKPVGKGDKASGKGDKPGAKGPGGDGSQ